LTLFTEAAVLSDPPLEDNEVLAPRKCDESAKPKVEGMEEKHTAGLAVVASRGQDGGPTRRQAGSCEVQIRIAGAGELGRRGVPRGEGIGRRWIVSPAKW
jgi:hypothetical protein